MNRMTYSVFIIAITLMMGLSFPIVRIGMNDGASPFMLMGVRFLFAGGIMALAMMRRPQPRGAKQWGKIVLLGVVNMAGVMGSASFSMRWITSGESAILTFTNPLLVIVISALFLAVRYRARQWIGTVLGLAGVVITFGTGLNVSTGTFIGLLSALFFAVGTLLAKRWGDEFDTFVLAGYQMLVGGLVLLGLSAMAEHPRLPADATSFGVLTYLVLFSSIVQFALWFYLLKKTDPARTSAFLFLAPFFGVLGGWAMIGEPMHWYVAAGGALICLGIFLVNWQTGRKRSLPT
ncbi:DMT family transporter [Cohnella zeiphila]|uniref:EamA family transporter n=1 Tax=Cohnella zeiphila TaxID=2761120 RepID=A0A7X0SUN4_9BACL|nr:DMT family transporter [Cohnella zeiphila]MBB6734193.1 EamA family transporter [Cohnella zeiphila]